MMEMNSHFDRISYFKDTLQHPRIYRNCDLARGPGFTVCQCDFRPNLRTWLKEYLKDSQSDLIDLGRLALKSTPTADLMKNALLLASELDLSAYDACYALLAQQLGIHLVTADQPLARKLEFAVFLGDLDIQLPEE
jgi:hypothetical protein